MLDDSIQKHAYIHLENGQFGSNTVNGNSYDRDLLRNEIDKLHTLFKNKWIEYKTLKNSSQSKEKSKKIYYECGEILKRSRELVNLLD